MVHGMLNALIQYARHLLRHKWSGSSENGIDVQTAMGVTFTKRHRYCDREIQPVEGNTI